MLQVRKAILERDNFNSLLGTRRVGLTFSEWALANPTALISSDLSASFLGL
jgi:hypothetical protein